jgi:hypothetical protein
MCCYHVIVMAGSIAGLLDPKARSPSRAPTAVPEIALITKATVQEIACPAAVVTGANPMRCQHRGGRKRIVAPDGTAIVPTSKPQPDGTLVEALARAWRWQRLLDESVCASISDIGDAENISKSYVSRILRLALLAPDIVEGILAGRADQSLMLERLERPLPMDWCEQVAFLSLSVRVHGPWVGS